MMKILGHEMPVIVTVRKLPHHTLQHPWVRFIGVDVAHFVAGAEQVIPVVGLRLICSCTLDRETGEAHPREEITLAIFVSSGIWGRLKVHLVRAEQFLQLPNQVIRTPVMRMFSMRAVRFLLHYMALPVSESGVGTAWKYQ